MKELRHPEEYTDTDPRAMEAWIAALREKTPGERLAMALELSHFALQLSEAGMRARFPEASEHEIRMRVASLHIPRELMITAYGWDPEHANAG